MMDKSGLLEGHFYFDPNDPIYTDHFPGHPVVPGTMIIHAFLSATKGSAWQLSPSAIHNFRFKRFIQPGRYLYRIQKQSRPVGSASCRLFDGKDLVAAGHLIG